MFIAAGVVFLVTMGTNVCWCELLQWGGLARRGSDMWSDKGSVFLSPRPLPTGGVAIGFSVYFLHPGIIHAQVWRPVGNDFRRRNSTTQVHRRFRLVKQWELAPRSIQCRQNIPLHNLTADGACYSFAKGDYFGVSSREVPWAIAQTKMPDERMKVYNYWGESDLNAGRVPLEGHTSEMIVLDLPYWFSINMIIHPGYLPANLIHRDQCPPVNPFDEETAGHCQANTCPPLHPLISFGEVVKPVTQGLFSIQGGIVILVQRVHLEGVLIAWAAYFRNRRNSHVALQLWRPTDGAGRNFTLVAEKDMKYNKYKPLSGQQNITFDGSGCWRLYPGDRLGLMVIPGYQSYVDTIPPVWPARDVRVQSWTFVSRFQRPIPGGDDAILFNRTLFTQRMDAVFYIDTEAYKYNGTIRCPLKVNLSSAQSFRRLPTYNETRLPEDCFEKYNNYSPEVSSDIFYLIFLIVAVFGILMARAK